jgi:hypothetical protein
VQKIMSCCYFRIEEISIFHLKLITAKTDTERDHGTTEHCLTIHVLGTSNTNFACRCVSQ